MRRDSPSWISDHLFVSRFAGWPFQSRSPPEPMPHRVGVKLAGRDDVAGGRTGPIERDQREQVAQHDVARIAKGNQAIAPRGTTAAPAAGRPSAADSFQSAAARPIGWSR